MIHLFYSKAIIEKLYPLNEILNEITSLKFKLKQNEIIMPSQDDSKQSSSNLRNQMNINGTKSVPNSLNSLSNGTNILQNQKLQQQQQQHQQHQIQSVSTTSLESSSQKNLLVYNNLYHQAIMNQQQQTENLNSSNSRSSQLKVVPSALDQINSATNLIEKNLLLNSEINNSNNYQNGQNVMIDSSSSSISSPPSPCTYSSEATVNLINLKSPNSQQKVKHNYIVVFKLNKPNFT